MTSNALAQSCTVFSLMTLVVFCPYMHVAAVSSTPKFRTSCYSSLHFFQVHFHTWWWIQRETFEGEKFRGLVKNTIFAEKTFADCARLCRAKGHHASKFRGETIANSHKPQNLRTFSSTRVSSYTVVPNPGLAWYTIVEGFFWMLSCAVDRHVS